MNLNNVFIEFNESKDMRGQKHKVSDILVMSIYGILCNHTDFVNMTYFLELHSEYFTKLLNLKHGIPSHDTFSRTFRLLDNKKFLEIFMDWIQTALNDDGKTIAIDGKAIKSSTDKINKGNTPYIVSAFLTDLKISIGEVKVDDKSNEITAIPELIKLLDIKDKFITMDAMGTQSDIAKLICEKKGNYILKVKANQKNLLDEIKTTIDSEIDDNSSFIDVFSTNYEKNHGRIEKRDYFLSYDISGITNKEDWGSVKAIGKIIVTREENEKITVKEHYYIMNKKITMDDYVSATRKHWNIECSLHWVLDVILDEDHSTSKLDNAIQNLSLLRKYAYNMARMDESFEPKTTLKKKLTNYSYNFSLIEKLIKNNLYRS